MKGKRYFLLILACAFSISILPTNAYATSGSVETGMVSIGTYSTQSTTSGQWIQSADGRWWYKHSDGSYTKNDWEYIGNSWYYFDANGWMVTGWLHLSGKWYYLSSSGAMVTGWQKIDNVWYYFNSNGVMQTGWLQLSGKWYYLSNSGAMVTGWQKIDNLWYYFFGNGVMNNQTMEDTLDGANRTHYFMSSGVWLYTVSLIEMELVDNGKHLDWGGSTKYSTYVTKAVNTWNDYKPGIIRKDSPLTLQDVTISDYYDESTTTGITSAAGTIKLNTYQLDMCSANEIQNTITHELGHALGLGHNYSSDIMYKNQTTKISLSENDKKSYDASYNRY